MDDRIISVIDSAMNMAAKDNCAGVVCIIANLNKQEKVDVSVVFSDPDIAEKLLSLGLGHMLQLSREEERNDRIRSN